MTDATPEGVLAAARQLVDHDATQEALGKMAMPPLDQAVVFARALLAAHQREEALRAEVERLMRVEAGEMEDAYRDGYSDAVDPAYAEKALRRNGVKAEPHEALAEDFFWQNSATFHTIALRAVAALRPAPVRPGDDEEEACQFCGGSGVGVDPDGDEWNCEHCDGA